MGIQTIVKKEPVQMIFGNHIDIMRIFDFGSYKLSYNVLNSANFYF